jgi:Fic family protein
MNDSIFAPNFTVTDNIRGAIAAVDRNRWLIDNILLMPKHEAWIRRDVSVRRASGTTRIEGASLDEAAVGNLRRKNPVGKLSEDEQANVNAIQAYEFIDYVSDQRDIRVDELVIRQIDREFLRGAIETLTPGAYRKGQNTVGRYNPPDRGDVPGLMRSFALWLREENDLDPIVRAGIAHVHLVAIHPFWDGNGRTARGLATLMLQRSPFSFKKLLSLESYMFSIRDGYFSAIEATLGTRFAPDYDATPWLEFFTASLMVHSIELTGRLTDWHRSMSEVHKDFEKFDLNHRQVDGFAYALQTGKIARAEYMEITGASGATASRDLARLVETGWLIPQGKTRARTYFPQKHSLEAVSKAPSEQLPLLE